MSSVEFLCYAQKNVDISATSSGIDKCEVASIDVTVGNTKCLATRITYEERKARHGKNI
jgi:hypothetical protein